MKKIHHNLVVWEQDDILYLNTHYLELCNEEMARHLGVSATTIGAKLRELGLSRPRWNPPHAWTGEELSYLMEHYPNEPTCDIAQHLRLSEGTVKKKADQMCLKKSPSYSKASYSGRYVRNYKHSERNVGQE